MPSKVTIPKFPRCRLQSCGKYHEPYPIPVPQDTRPIVTCDTIQGKCCPACHRMEDKGLFGLQAATSQDNQTIYFSCCYKLRQIEEEIGYKLKGGVRGGRRRRTGFKITWEKVHQIRSLIGKRMPGKVAGGRGKTLNYTCVDLSKMTGIPEQLVGDIVNNAIWLE